MARTAAQSSSRRRAPSKGATARRAQRKQSSSKGLRVPGWLWGLVGLVAGFVLAQYFQQSAPPVATLMPKPASQASSASAPAASPATGQPAAEDEARMPTFEFYTLLPESEVVAPKVEAYQSTPRPSDDDSDAGDTPDAGQTAQAAGGGSFMLQAASFKNAADAKRLAGRLQNLGLLAKITTVQANGDQTWHRVQVGPYEDTRELSRAQDLMVTQGIEPLMIKLQD